MQIVRFTWFDSSARVSPKRAECQTVISAGTLFSRQRVAYGSSLCRAFARACGLGKPYLSQRRINRFSSAFLPTLNITDNGQCSRKSHHLSHLYVPYKQLALGPDFSQILPEVKRGSAGKRELRLD
jgi:hypothetical protein